MPIALPIENYTIFCAAFERSKLKFSFVAWPCMNLAPIEQQAYMLIGVNKFNINIIDTTRPWFLCADCLDRYSI